MEATSRLRLPRDAILLPLAGLPASAVRHLGDGPRDWVLTRPGRRSPLRLLAASAAGLVAEFRSPSTIVEAVLRYCQARQAEPETTLEEAHPLLADLFAAGLLVEEGDAERSSMLPALEPGERFAGFEILDGIRVEEDTELYQVRQGPAFAALKVERAAGPGARRAIQREAAILGHLAGRIAPRLLETGRWQGLSFLVMEWCRGVPVDRAAAELRRAGDRHALLALRRSVDETLAELHSLGVTHGDVRPEKVLVDVGGKVVLVGFGRSARHRRLLPAVAAEERRTVDVLLDGIAGDSGEAAGPAGSGSALLARTLERLRPDRALAGIGLPDSESSSSLSSGLAGIALGLYRMARAREDDGLLAAADFWITREIREAGPAGVVSPFLADSALPAVEALIAHALGDEPRAARALERFAGAARRPSAELDLFLGRTGLLLACSLLHRVCPGGPGGRSADLLRALGEEIAASLWQELDAMPPVGCRAPRPNLGIAHGWAGFLYATLSFHRATGSPLPPRLAGRLGELADQAIPWGRGLRWRWEVSIQRPGEMPSAPGWCNGSAGLVFLWMLAYRILRDPVWLDLARGAAWHAWEGELPGDTGSLCCGLAGRAYSLLHLSRHGEGGVWLERSRELARRAAEIMSRSGQHPHSLYRGELGVAVLTADLERPQGAAMPFFEEEEGPGSPS